MLQREQLPKMFILSNLLLISNIFLLVFQSLSQSKSEVRQWGWECKLHVQLLDSDWLRTSENQHNGGFPFDQKTHTLSGVSGKEDNLTRSTQIRDENFSPWVSVPFHFPTAVFVLRFRFRKIQQYFEFSFDDFTLTKFPYHFRILAWMGFVPVASVTLHVISCGYYHLSQLWIFNGINFALSVKSRRLSNRGMFVSLYSW